MKEISKAILQVMKTVQYLQNDQTVGFGGSSYRSITDKKVRTVLRPAMVENGLFITQDKVEFKESVETWTKDEKRKQQIKITALCSYTLRHTSGESITLQSVGTGVDSMDKAPGKATTYALKYALLNLFLIPTGADGDKVHSSSYELPNNKKQELKQGSDKWAKAVKALEEGKTTVELIKKHYILSAENEDFLTNLKTDDNA